MTEPYKRVVTFAGVWIGGWRDKDGNYEINITLVFENQRDAERFAMAHDQKEIFDVVRGTTIITGGKGRTHWINPDLLRGQ